MSPEQKKYRGRKQLLGQMYGLTVEEYEAMVRWQNGLCFLCRRFPSGKYPLVVDHDHKTGKVRKLLCGSCNSFLARIEADPEWLERAAVYIGAREPKLAAEAEAAK
jgi:hypothetical protein